MNDAKRCMFFFSERTYARTDGRTMDPPTDGRTDGRTGEQRTGGRMDGRTDARRDGLTDERTDGRGNIVTYGCLWDPPAPVSQVNKSPVWPDGGILLLVGACADPSSVQNVTCGSGPGQTSFQNPFPRPKFRSQRYLWERSWATFLPKPLPRLNMQPDFVLEKHSEQP